MPGRGPAPKPHRQRERDERRSQAGTLTIRPDDIARGPELEADAFPENVMEIYERLRRTPQAQLYEDSEWLMIETLLLPAYDAYLNRSHSAALAVLGHEVGVSSGLVMEEDPRA